MFGRIPTQEDKTISDNNYFNNINKDLHSVASHSNDIDNTQVNDHSNEIAYTSKIEREFIHLVDKFDKKSNNWSTYNRKANQYYYSAFN